MTDGEAVAAVAEALLDPGPDAAREAAEALNARARGSRRRWCELLRRGERRAELLENGEGRR